MSAPSPLSEQDWQVRWYVYNFFVEQARPPTSSEVAEHFGLNAEEAAAIMERLHQRHLFLLDRDTREVRIANPLSAVPTGFRVHAGGRTYWANCAWDALGIPAMLGSNATIEATIPNVDEPYRYEVRDEALAAPDFLVHFPLPVRQWYDDLVHT